MLALSSPFSAASDELQGSADDLFDQAQLAKDRRLGHFEHAGQFVDVAAVAGIFQLEKLIAVGQAGKVVVVVSRGE